jgi:hypothetical protein
VSDEATVWRVWVAREGRIGSQQMLFVQHPDPDVAAEQAVLECMWVDMLAAPSYDVTVDPASLSLAALPDDAFVYVPRPDYADPESWDCVRAGDLREQPCV